MTGRAFVPREPEQEPELLSMQYHAAGFFFPGGLGERRECGMSHCSELAVYEGEYSDASWIFLCVDHGEEAADYAGLEEVDPEGAESPQEATGTDA